MKYWIVMWDCNGVEFLADVTANHPDNWAKQHLFDSIKDSKKVESDLPFNLQSMILRARYNNQRHYEIYMFSSNEGIEKEDIESWFETDPQSFANWVRENNLRTFYSDRVTAKPAIV
jgi:hypothetical protein